MTDKKRAERGSLSLESQTDRRSVLGLAAAVATFGAAMGIVASGAWAGKQENQSGQAQGKFISHPPAEAQRQNKLIMNQGKSGTSQGKLNQGH